jgi:ABC-type branched-subunit amino acid transport system substrate-binding protein
VIRSMKAVAAVCAVVALAGCGTTVSGADRLSSGGSEGLGLGGPGGGATTGPGSTGLGGGAGSGSTAGVTSVGSGQSSSLGGSSSGGSAASNGVARGVTATTIYVGMVHASNTDSVNAAAGVGDLALGDPTADTKAVIDYINHHGGVAGRNLQLVEAPFDSASTADVETQWAAVCAKFTQDNPKVFAVLDQGTASYRRCIHNAGVAQIDDDLPQASVAEFRNYPGFIELGYPNLDRLAAEQVTALAGQNYFQPWDTVRGRPATAGKTKVGIVTYDDPEFAEAVNNVLVPRLKSLNYNPVVARISDVSRASDYGAQSAAVKSAQLKFASSGVDHVIMFEGNGGLSLFFMNNAYTQGYRPRYGLNSSSGIEQLIEGGEVQPSQAQGALGFGWIPGFDIPAALNPDNGPYSSPARRQCLAIMADHGITFPSTNAEGVALGACSRLFLLKKALDTTPKLVNIATFIRAVDAIGAKFDDGGSLGEFLGTGHHDGVSKVYYWQWQAKCPVGSGGCMNYVGSRRTIA